MLYRPCAALIGVFWLVMAGLLVRQHVGAGDAALPGAARQRIVWDGSWELEKTLTTRQCTVGLTLREAIGQDADRGGHQPTRPNPPRENAHRLPADAG